MSFLSNLVIHFHNELFQKLGVYLYFSFDSLRWGFRRPFRFRETIKHMEFIANRSVGITCLTGGFTGMVFAFQVYQGFRIVNAGNLVGATVALGITRELGPVLTGLIVAARAGGAMAARIGTMRVTEQIDALEVMGVSPKQYLVAPRIIAAVISLPLLTGIFNMVALVGAYLVTVMVLNQDEALFIDKVTYYLNPRDIGQSLVKGFVFGLFFSSICTYKGFTTRGGAKGVGDATNEGVVASMVTIIVSDYFLTNIITSINRWR